MLLINSLIAFLGVISLSSAVVARQTLRRDCTTVTVLSSPETVTSSNHVQLASYEICGSTLSASLYVYNDDYDKIVTLYYLTSSGTTGSVAGSYSSSLSNNWELWTVSATAAGAVEITGASYVDSDKSVTYTTPSIYQIVTDRFARTDRNVTYPCDATNRSYCGGSYQGIINMLDYVQGMGFTAIWISPIVENIPDETGWGYAYHGYWTKNIFALNTNFSTAADLIELATELHNRGMYLMVDIVINHFAFSGNHANVEMQRHNSTRVLSRESR
ncbi:glycoside hydrolase superfamily [Lipomyces kononenkoae]|uniref:Glycoside hydrolase superfamily n=1 Tax=Lipomyces kononenkoae TaxID=34357 RepID=A0ACC3SW61_LIPKO